MPRSPSPSPLAPPIQRLSHHRRRRLTRPAGASAQVEWIACEWKSDFPSKFQVAVVFALLQLKPQRRRYAVSRRISGDLFQIINGIGKLRSSGAEESAFAAWARRCREQQEIGMRIGRLDEHVVAFSAVVPALADAALFAFALRQGPEQLAVGDFLAAYAMSMTFFVTIARLGQSFEAIAAIVPGVAQIRPVLDATLEGIPAGDAAVDLSGEFRLDHVSFRCSRTALPSWKTSACTCGRARWSPSSASPDAARARCCASHWDCWRRRPARCRTTSSGTCSGRMPSLAAAMGFPASSSPPVSLPPTVLRSVRPAARNGAPNCVRIAQGAGFHKPVTPEGSVPSSDTSTDGDRRDPRRRADVARGEPGLRTDPLSGIARRRSATVRAGGRGKRSDGPAEPGALVAVRGMGHTQHGQSLVEVRRDLAHRHRASREEGAASTGPDKHRHHRGRHALDRWHRHVIALSAACRPVMSRRWKP